MREKSRASFYFRTGHCHKAAALVRLVFNCLQPKPAQWLGELTLVKFKQLIHTVV